MIARINIVIDAGASVNLVGDDYDAPIQSLHAVLEEHGQVVLLLQVEQV
jgi:hypothetical protein